MSHVKTRYIVLAAVLVAGIASPAPAATHAALSYDLTLTGDSYSGIHPSGTIVGTFGGLAVDGSYAGGTWTLRAGGHSFAAGTYACERICRFRGTALAGRRVVYGWTSQVPTWDARRQVSRGKIAGLFASRQAWSAQVAAWARANHLPPNLQTRLIIDAETGM